jgi:hypothetical protein
VKRGQPVLVHKRAAGIPNALHMLVMIVAVGGFGALIGTTQWMATHFGYDPGLGRPLVVTGGSICASWPRREAVRPALGSSRLFRVREIVALTIVEIVSTARATQGRRIGENFEGDSA